ncbi:TPA: MBOAT family O-acyltransferase [Legionella bozemanae]|uniref:MBOAT family O-acyltransferase n=1 Tax=Legionella bozemanae TaxID=447 RepID=UPI00216B08DF|nr:MBOAT family O-acyltransferase [Legionella bozemanae]
MWNVKFLTLLLMSVIFNYMTSYLIARTVIYKKTALIFAISINIILLIYYKYVNFFMSVSNGLFGTHFTDLNIILPIGISFFTFTQIAFLVDVYKGITKEHNFMHYLLFITYFPHLIAGPILHHKQMMSQFANNIFKINTQNISVGLTFFVFGLAKKIILADSFAIYANTVFSAANNSQPLTFGNSWCGVLAYTLQLYFDFSGYSDMAIGLSLLFNIRLPLNFYSPYKSANIIEFWRRWHLTLSKFLRDYLYIPLGGNRRGLSRRYLNLMITMLLGGMWHGAGWTFIIWGGLHGIYLVFNHLWLTLKPYISFWKSGHITQGVAIFITLLSVMVSWVFFRADNVRSAYHILKGMFGFRDFSLAANNLYNSNTAFPMLAIGIAIACFCPNTYQMLRQFKPTCNDFEDQMRNNYWSGNQLMTNDIWKLNTLCAITVGSIFFVCLMYMLTDILTHNNASQFLYFQF